MDEGRGGLLSAGGVLSVIGGVLEVIGGGLMVGLIGTGVLPKLWHILLLPGPGDPFVRFVPPVWLIVIGGILIVLGVVAIAGGVSATKRGSFGLSLAGAICALPSGILGLLAIIFVFLGKKEF
jgi:hypothetical protein